MMSRLSYLFLIALLFTATVVTAQKKEKKPKANLTRVDNIILKSESKDLTVEDYTIAKENVDIAAVDEKKSKLPKSWYLRGKVYQMIYNYDGDVPGVTKPEAVKTAAEAYNKVSTLGKDSDPYTLYAQQDSENFYRAILNKGVDAYNGDNVADAVTYFEYCALLRPESEIGYKFAAASATDAAREIKDDEAASKAMYERALDNYRKLIKITPTDTVYMNMARVQRNGLKDPQGALSTIEEAKAKIGEDNVMLNREEVMILFETKQVEKAMTKIEQAIKSDPDNPGLYIRQGLLYDQLISAEKEAEKEDRDEEKIRQYQDAAAEAYQKTINIDPENFLANFNYAVIISQKANFYFNKANAMSLAEYRKNGEKVNNQGLEVLVDAVPSMEKAYELQPEDQDVLFALQSFYTKLDKKDKLEKISAEIERLGYNN
ncbi:MAG: hypothetical protein AAFO69_18700 [Bacteroidota bacterium]